MSREDIKGAGGLASSATVTVLPDVLGGATPLPVPLPVLDDEDVEMAVGCLHIKPELLELANDEAAEGFSKFDWAPGAVATEFVGGDICGLSNCRPPDVVTAATEATALATSAAFFIFCFSLNLRIISPLKCDGGALGSFPALVLLLFGRDC